MVNLLSPSPPHKILWLKGIAGLGNRLACIANAIDYCQRNRRRLYVDWSDGMFSAIGHNIFSDYFQLHEVEHAKSEQQLSLKPSFSCYPPYHQQHCADHLYRHYWNFRHPYCQYLPFPRSKYFKGRLAMLTGYWQHLEPGQEKPHTWYQFLRGMCKPKNFPRGEYLPAALPHDVVIYADYIPQFSPTLLRHHLKLSAMMEETLDHHWCKIPRPNVGIHVRYSDKTPAIHSIAAIALKIKHQLTTPQLRHHTPFLATDRQDVLEVFSRTFDNLHYLDMPRSPNQRGLHQWSEEWPEHQRREVLKMALIDLWILARCDQAMLQPNSAFSVIVHALRQSGSHWLEA